MEFIHKILLYNQDAPLLFTRFYFWGFLAISLAVYSILYRQRALRNAYLFIISLFFYYKTSGFFFFLLIFSTVVDYSLGLSIYKAKSRTWKKITWTTILRSTARILRLTMTLSLQ